LTFLTGTKKVPQHKADPIEEINPVEFKSVFYYENGNITSF
jgi:hypothetical protein